MTEKAAVVKLNSDGEVVQCAKGAAPAECGYVEGAKVCGKCGAMAVSMKDDVPAVSVKQLKKKKMTGMMAVDADLDEELEMEEEVDDMDEEGMELVDDEEMDDDIDEDDEMESDEKMYGVDEEDDDMYVRRAAPKKKKKPGMNMMPDAEMMDDEDMPKGMNESDEDEEEDLYASEAATRNKMRRRRLSSMGFKSEDFDDQAFVCAFDKKVYPGAASVCDSCVGGCVAEKGMPALIEIEGMAEDMFRGKILDSGYSDEADLFIVDVERKDGKPVEVFFDGSTGEMMGWHKLPEDVMQVKSALQNKVMISFGEAADIATKSVNGEIVAVEPDVFEGFDVYAVEIEGVNGKSYDVFVALDGEVLGYDEYTMEEASDIEAEAAEIALKRAYSEDSRKDMASSGFALDDGSFPIKDEADLRNAIQAYGRASDKTKAKAHIMKRAVDLGLEDAIPMSWVSSSDMDKAKKEKSAEALVGSEESNFLSSLMEFEMLTVEQELENPKSE